MPNSSNGPTETTSQGHKRTMGFLENVKQKIVPLANVLKKQENYIIHALLTGVFVSLAIRSYDRQHQIDAIEEERAFFERENKALKKSMWTLKEGLLQEAAKQNDHDLICRLKAIFGQTSTIEERRPDSTVPKTKFVI
ncbi:uncharacterized protein LOC131048518 [Cryptomeria japonica]|uniref:uncharacterized protein LOC131048518 n=1 Tax=Cryptomeria japonica TaxID=3369 RepID=UPI0025ABB416|nr:uncharacterized protein LOC131048518 [Cryptomeria japonica]